MFNQEVVFYVLIGRVVCLSTETNKVTKGGLRLCGLILYDWVEHSVCKQGWLQKTKILKYSSAKIIKQLTTNKAIGNYEQI